LEIVQSGCDFVLVSVVRTSEAGCAVAAANGGAAQARATAEWAVVAVFEK
jgi:hypothetical protein